MDFLIHIDYIIFNLINQDFTSAWLDVLFPFLTDLHKNIWFKVIAFPALFAVYFYRYKKAGIIYFVFCLLSLTSSDFTGTRIFKKVIERPRPFQTEGLNVIKRSPGHGGSFISNHSSNMFAFATYTSAFFPPVRYAVFGFAILVAYSRVYNGVHFPLDVICGAMWGIAVSLMFLLLVRWLAKKFHFGKESRPL